MLKPIPPKDEGLKPGTWKLIANLTIDFRSIDCHSPSFMDMDF